MIQKFMPKASSSKIGGIGVDLPVAGSTPAAACSKPERFPSALNFPVPVLAESRTVISPSIVSVGDGDEAQESTSNLASFERGVKRTRWHQEDSCGGGFNL
jgi:hypothetical protein